MGAASLRFHRSPRARRTSEVGVPIVLAVGSLAHLGGYKQKGEAVPARLNSRLLVCLT